jgi:hypothetical protein
MDSISLRQIPDRKYTSVHLQNEDKDIAKNTREQRPTYFKQ